MPARRNNNNDLLFISDVNLRKKIEDAIEMISLLYLTDKGMTPKHNGFSKEIRRTMILYSASIIEATLLFLYKKKNFSLKKIEYKNIHVLPTSYQHESDKKLVIASQTEVERDDRELMLDNLLKFFVDKKIIDILLKEKIDKAKIVRNTFHLSKSRKGIGCGQKSVDNATEAVVNTFEQVRSYLAENP